MGRESGGGRIAQAAGMDSAAAGVGSALATRSEGNRRKQGSDCTFLKQGSVKQGAACTSPLGKIDPARCVRFSHTPIPALWFARTTWAEVMSRPCRPGTRHPWKGKVHSDPCFLLPVFLFLRVHRGGVSDRDSARVCAALAPAGSVDSAAVLLHPLDVLVHPPLHELAAVLADRAFVGEQPVLGLQEHFRLAEGGHVEVAQDAA